MAGQGVKLAVGATVVAVVAGVGIGLYANMQRAAADEARGTQPVASAPAPAPASAEPTAPAALQDTPPPSVEPVPPVATVAPVAAKPPAPKPPAPICGGAGPSQLIAEKYLAAHPEFGPVSVDGTPSAADCATLKKFQTRYGISPTGYAGTLTGKVVTRLANAALSTCKQNEALTVCVDLTSQTMWVLQGGKIVLGPTTVRTGKDGGYETPAGRFHIQNKKVDTTSTIFKGVKLPYWQRITQDMGFHETPSYLYDSTSLGSHGCVNLLRRDAIALYGLTQVGTEVHIFGRKPGT